jgi:hypothetical protein
MKYAFERGSNAMIHISSFIKIDSSFEKLTCTDADDHSVRAV